MPRASVTSESETPVSDARERQVAPVSNTAIEVKARAASASQERRAAGRAYPLLASGAESDGEGRGKGG